MKREKPKPVPQAAGTVLLVLFLAIVSVLSFGIGDSLRSLLGHEPGPKASLFYLLTMTPSLGLALRWITPKSR